MWPNSKGKGGKGGSSKSNDGDDEKPRSKPRATRTKLKAMTAEAARALQETGDQPAAKAKMSPEELLEAEIFRAADQASAEQLAREEQARASGPEFLKIPEQSASLDDQLSGVWKARLMGGNKPTPQNTAIPSPANRVAMEAAEKARTNAQHESMIGIVDRMFDQFQNLAYDFNQVASASDLELTWIRPSINRENVGNWHSGAQYISVFSGRISTRYWTLVVRGSFETITAHIIPADKLLTFNSAPANYMPMLEMMPYFDGAMVYWSAGPKQLKSEDIQQAARAVLDSLVQVAQEDVPPSKPIDLFAPAPPVVDTASQSMSTSEPSVSALGGDIDYSERYRQHFSSDSSANLANNPNNPSNPNSNQGNQFSGGYGSTGNSSVNNNSLNSFRQFPPSQPSNMMGNQPAGNAQNSSDDWKPVVRSVRGAAGPQPLQHLRQFQNAPVETSTPTPTPLSSPPGAPTTSPFGTPPSVTPSFASSPNANSPNAPSANFSAPGRAQGVSNDDGWRGVDANSPSRPSPSGASSGFKPAFPALPATPAVSSDSFVGGTSQSLSGQRPAAGSANSPASSDDWNFVPVDKESPKQAQRDTGAQPPVNFPNNLFADMPASLGFPAASAPAGAPPERLNQPGHPAQPQPPSQTGSSSNFSSPFARPFSAVSAAKPNPVPASGQPPAPPIPGPAAAPPTPRPAPGPAPGPTPVSAPVSAPAPAPTPGPSQGEAEDSDANPFYTPLVAPSDNTATGASPWSAAPTAAQAGNKADFNQTASSTHTGMISPPKAPMPAKEAAGEVSFFEPELPVSDVEAKDTKTVEIASTGQFSVDRFAFDIANQAVPAAEPATRLNPEPHAAEVIASVPEGLEVIDFAKEPDSEPEPINEIETDEAEELVIEYQSEGDSATGEPATERSEDSPQASFDDGVEDFESAPDLEVGQPDSDLEKPNSDQAEISLVEQEHEDYAEEEARSNREQDRQEQDREEQGDTQIDEDSSYDDSDEDSGEESVVAAGQAFDQSEHELASLSQIEDDTVESIAELEEELAHSADDLNQTVSPWRGPADHELPESGSRSDLSSDLSSGLGSGFRQEQAPGRTIEQPISMPAFTPISASLGSSAPSVVAASEHSLKNEIERVLTAFDKELELISTKGSDAFARRDLKGAEHMIKLAEMISEYKAGLAKLKDEYDKDLT